MSKYPNKNTLHNDYFESLDDFLNRSHKIVKNDGTCKSTPPSFLPKNKTQRIVAVGDLHGDFDVLLIALYKAGLIDMKGHWIGGNTVVIQVGDILDKGGRGVPEIEIPECSDDSEWRIILFLEYLNIEAKKQDGAVFLLLGNHEIMNFTGDMRYTTAATLAYFGGQDKRKEIFSRGGVIAQKIACMTNTVMRLGDWVFVHAGITPEIMKLYDTIDEINDSIRNYILGITDIDSEADENSDEYKLYKLIGDRDGVLWTRKYGHDIDNKVCNSLNKTLELIPELDSENGGMVVGHTVKDEIMGDCKGKLFQIDRGMSTGFGLKKNDDERVEFLEIIDGVPKSEYMDIESIKSKLKLRKLSVSGSKKKLQKRLDHSLKSQKIYIFIYGSLLNKQYRKEAIGEISNIIGENKRILLSKKAGFSLDFCHRMKNNRGKMTALAIYHTKNPEDIEGAILEIDRKQLELLDKHKHSFLRTPLNWNLIKYSDNLNNYKDNMLFTYYTDTPQNPDKEYPILDIYNNIIEIIKSPLN